MTEKDTKHYTSDFFVLRTPLLPVEDLLWWSNGLIAPELDDSSPEKLEQALARDRSVLRARLKTLIERAEVREAIFVASPGLEERIPTWLTNPASADGVRVERALVKYLMRMITRSTPFGLFSGCSIGRVGDQTDIRLKSRTEYQRHTRLDMVLLSNVCTQLNANPAVRHELRFYPNSTLRRLGRTWRYIETRGSYKGGLSHHLVETPTTEHLEIVFAAAQGGATIETLACALVDSDRDVSSEEAEAFVIELIDNDLLVSTLTPNLTGPESAQELVSRLATLTSAQSAYCLLSAANDSLRELDAAGLGVDPNRYRMICARVENALGIPVAPEGTFLTDLWKPVVDAVIGTNIVRELERGLPILQAMSYLKRTSDLQRSMQISRFQEAFVERYGEQEIPLLEALDDDTGLEFGPSGPDGRDLSLLDGLRFPPRSEAPTYSWDHTLQSLLRNVQDAIATGSNEIEVSPSDFQAVAQSADPLPDSFYLMATVLAASERTLKENDYRILVQSGFGPSAARILGRFALTSQELTLVLNDHLRLEEGLSPDAVFAEIVHFPGARVGNILCRPAFRSYDITYLGRSGRPEHEQLPASDLLVSTVGGRTVLRSARLGKRVIPRLTSAHHYEAPQLVKTYRFLCAIQDEGLTTNLSWWWGPLAASAFLPRVVSGRLVLSRARWRLGEAEISKLKTIRSGPLYQHIQALRRKRQLPRHVLLAHGDNELPIDLENVLSIEILVDLLRGLKEANLLEMLPNSEAVWVRGSEGRFFHEIIVPFLRVPAERDLQPNNGLAAITSFQDPPSRPLTRTFVPGSEWLYVKIYTGEAAADDVLRSVLRPIEAARAKAMVDLWFFIRFIDPHFHVRLRVHLTDVAHLACVLDSIIGAVQPLVEERVAWKIQIDTYEREVERYGGEDGIRLSERVFHADSEAVANILWRSDYDQAADSRWLETLLGVDDLLSNLGFDLQQKLSMMKGLRRSHDKMFRVDVQLKRDIGRKFRMYRSKLKNVLAEKNESELMLTEATAAFLRRSKLLLPVMDELRLSEQRGLLSVPLKSLASSYVHMHVNRMLLAAQPEQEMVIYDFLHRLYDGMMSQSMAGQQSFPSTQEPR